MEGNQLALAFILAVAVQSVTKYLTDPIRKSEAAKSFLVRIGLASYKSYKMYMSSEITIWVIPYITFLLGVVSSLWFGVDIIAQYAPNAPKGATVAMTAALIGGGSNMIHTVISSAKAIGLGVRRMG